jgi:hypothetical protein
MKQLKQIPKFANEDEEREFWSTHSFTDYIDPKSWKRGTPSKEVSEAAVRRMLADMSPEVERLSREKKTTVEEMVRQLVAAGLETARRGGLHPA